MVVLAHQGGWDEILFVAVPLAVFAVVLAVANSRAKRRAAERDGGPRAGDSSSTS
jgi:hypothetical protein